MVDLSSVSCKKASVDTRNNWVVMMFKCKCAYYCFGKQSHIDTCSAAFKELEVFGFEFREMGFGGNHVHLQVNVPKIYSVMVAEIMLKSRSARRMFEKHSGFRKRYPRGSFWSGYEHHQSTGMQGIEEAGEYIRNQAAHHGIEVVDDTQMKLAEFS